MVRLGVVVRLRVHAAADAAPDKLRPELRVSQELNRETERRIGDARASRLLEEPRGARAWCIRCACLALCLSTLPACLPATHAHSPSQRGTAPPLHRASTHIIHTHQCAPRGVTDRPPNLRGRDRLNALPGVGVVCGGRARERCIAVDACVCVCCVCACVCSLRRLCMRALHRR
jgi:hypothetical protein